MSRKTIWLILAAGLSAVAVFFLVQWSRKWDHPQTETSEVYKGKLEYLNRPVEVSISCEECPSALVGSRTEKLHFGFTLKGLPQLYGQPASVPTRPGKNIYVWVDATNATLRLPSDSNVWPIGPADGLSGGIRNNLPVDATPSGEGTVVLAFHFESWDGSNAPYDVPGLGFAVWKPPTHDLFIRAASPALFALIVFGGVLGALLWSNRWHRQLRSTTEQELAKVRDRPWEAAQIKLEEYFRRNLFQVNLVFWGAVIVTAVGFVFVLIGILILYSNPDHLKAGGLAAASGVLTQFVGATFMVIYRSVMAQASEFMKVLDRINNVGMAVSELDQIPDELPHLKNDVRGHFVELLVGANYPAAKTGNREPERQPDKSAPAA